MKDPHRAGQLFQQVGLIFQNSDTQLFTSVYDELAFGPRQLGLDESEVEQRVKDTLGLQEIEHLRDRAFLPSFWWRKEASRYRQCPHHES